MQTLILLCQIATDAQQFAKTRARSNKKTVMQLDVSNFKLIERRMHIKRRMHEMMLWKGLDGGDEI